MATCSTGSSSDPFGYYTTVTGTTTTVGDSLYWDEDCTLKKYGGSLGCDWGSRGYWEQQRLPLTKGKQQFLLQQAQREARWLNRERQEDMVTRKEADEMVRKALGKDELTTKLKRAMKETKFIEPVPIEPSTWQRTTTVERLWKECDEWLKDTSLAL